MGKHWGLSPRVTHWIYTAIVRPTLTYGAVVWVSCLEKETNRACFDCSYKYPLSEFTEDQSGYTCNGCYNFYRKYVFGMGQTYVVEVDGVKYRVWYVDESIEEVCKEIRLKENES